MFERLARIRLLYVVLAVLLLVGLLPLSIAGILLSRRSAEELRAIAGGRWGEKDVGCTAIGASLHTGLAARVDWFETYCQTWHDWVNQAISGDVTAQNYLNQRGVAYLHADGSMYSSYLRSRLSIHLLPHRRSGRRRLYACDDLRAGCTGLVAAAHDGYPGSFDYLHDRSG